MRVLWFTNTPSCFSLGSNPYNGGGWIASAEKAFHHIPKVELAVSFLLDNQQFKSENNGVVYYPIPYYRMSYLQKISKYLSFISEKTLIKFEEKQWPYYLDKFKKIIDDFNPDIIHVWGSEGYFGLVSKITDIPVVLHVQGILNPYLNAFLPPFVSWNNYGKGIADRFNAFSNKCIWQMNCYRERVIYDGISYYLGRTDWDKRVCHVLNPSSEYFHVDEILRDPFYCDSERCIPDKLTIITTISNPLYKGFDLVLKTAKILKENLNLDFEWLCFGNINPSFIERNVGIKHQDVNVSIKGVISSEELKSIQLNATLYFHPSYIDNSPNSVCESQMLGVPVISTNVGGISSLVDDGTSGFLIPSNDPYQGAFLIERLFKDKKLNVTIGLKGKEEAKKRHNKDNIIRQILAVYSDVQNVYKQKM
jgi:glycosyltransferase involved in cell wall biosynthesis